MSMREILFHGKRIDNGEWVEGDLIHSYLKTGDTCIWCDDGIYQVDPSTVGQYTGLTDKNGKKVFEGDVIKYKDRLFGWILAEIRFDNGCYEAKRLHSCNSPAIDIVMNESEIEVVCTIHDNPELLEGAK